MSFHRLPFPLIALLCIIALGATLFWGYCWAWVPQFPIFAFLFNAHCPNGSEESHYPQEVDVLVSARYKPWAPYAAYLLPSGKKVIYDDGWTMNIYDLERQSHQPILFPDPINHWPTYLTDEWALVNEAGLLNLETNQRVPAEVMIREVNLAEGIPAELVPMIGEYPMVYVYRGNIILVPTYLGDTTTTPVIINAYIDNPTRENTERVVAHLLELGVEPINPQSTYTPDRRFYYAPADKSWAINPEVHPAIVDAQSHQPIVTFHRADYEPIGWADGQQGVVMQSAERTCVLLFFVCHAEFDRPILLLRQASEHLSSEQQVAFAAKDVAEAQAKRYADGGMLLLTAISIPLLVLTLWRWLKCPRPVA